MTEVAEREQERPSPERAAGAISRGLVSGAEQDSEDVGAPVPPDAPPDDEPGADDDDAQGEAAETAGEPSEAVDQKVIDKIFKQLDGAAKTYSSRLGAIMGEEANNLKLCPTCAPIEGMPHLMGFVLDAPLHDEAIARMRTALGLNDGIELKPDPYSHRCDTCDGKGYVATYSEVPGMEARVCDDCKGRGYIMAATSAQTAPLATTSGTESMLPASVPAALGIEPPEAEALRRQGYAVIPPVPPVSS